MTQYDSRLTPYLLGLLTGQEADELEQELANHAELRTQLTQVEDLIHDLTEYDMPMRPQPSVRECLLQSATETTRSPAMAQRFQDLFNLGSAHARELLTAAVDLSSTLWESTPMPGTYLLHFDGGPAVAEADCGLIYLEPGVTFPRHRHLGDEWALVLQGTIAEVDGRKFNIGDLAFSAAGSQHALQVVGDQAVVLAVVNFTGLRFETGPDSTP